MASDTIWDEKRGLTAMQAMGHSERLMMTRLFSTSRYTDTRRVSSTHVDRLDRPSRWERGRARDCTSVQSFMEGHLLTVD